MNNNNKLILGTAQFGLKYGINNTSGKIQFNQAHKILKYARDLGIKELDTAQAYGDSETVIYKCLKRGLNFNINTKINSTTDSFLSQIKTSINNLSVKKLHTILFHSMDTFKFFKNDIPHLNREFKGHLYDKIGVSIYSIQELEELIKYVGIIDTIQVPFNLLDNYSLKGESLRKAKKKGFKIQIRSVFLQGLFFMDETEILKGFKDLFQPIYSLKKISIENSISMRELCLRYAYSYDFIDNILIGVDNLNQIEENLDITKSPLETKTLNKINQIVIDSNLVNPSKWKKY